MEQRAELMMALDYACGASRDLVVFPVHATLTFIVAILRMG